MSYWSAILGGINHLSCPGWILNLKFSVSYWSAILKGMWVILSCPKLNLKFKISSEILVGDNGGFNHVSMTTLYLKSKIFSEILVGDNGGVLIMFPWPHLILNLKFSVRFWLVTMRGVNHLSMSRLNLKFKIFSELLVSSIRGMWVILSCPKLNLKFKIFSEILVGDNGGFNHVSMTTLYLKFKIFSEILVGDNGGGLIMFPWPHFILNLKFSVRFWLVTMRGDQSSFHVQAES